MDETILSTADGAILYDPRIFNHMAPDRLQPEGWAEREPVADAGGRGGIWFVAGGEGRFALRHYHRGGLIGRVLDDQFLWLGRDATRSFQEWRLLAHLADLGLPVPPPAAAAYRRQGVVYRADILTRRLDDVRSLAAALEDAPLGLGQWRRIGKTIRRFHEAGVWHADLNAHNIQLGSDGEVWVLDFDRGRIRSPGAWRRRNLERLERSLEKIGASGAALQREPGDWQALLAAYRGG